MKYFCDRRLLSEVWRAAAALLFITTAAAISAAADGHSMRKGFVVVSTRPLGINHTITDDDVRLVEKESQDLREAANLNSVIGRRVKRPIGANNVVKNDYLHGASINDIKKGDVVLIVVNSGNMNISTKGIARQDAVIGDSIKVENPASGKLITGMVVDAGVVEAVY